MIGHEGKKTLYDYFINLGYILNLNCGIYEKIGNFSIFYIDVELSDVGDQNIDKIISKIFECIQMLYDSFLNSDQNLINLYEEQKKLNDYNFKFQENEDIETKCMNYYEILSTHNIQLKYLLVIQYLFPSFEIIRKNALEILQLLNTSSCITIYTSKKYDSIASNIDEHYGTKYKIKKQNIKISKFKNELKLPSSNKYISTGTTIIKHKDIKPKKINIGYLLRTSIFENPNVSINIQMYLPLTILDKHTYTQTLLYFASILLNTSCEKYMCIVAGYHCDISFDMGKLNIAIQGNYKKILNVCEFFITTLINPKFTRDEFDRTIYSFKQTDINLSYEPPYLRISNYFNKNAFFKFYTNLDRLECYDKVDYQNTKNIANSIFELGTFNLLISGNCNNKLYKKIENVMFKIKPKNEYKSNEILDWSIINFNDSVNIIKIDKENTHEKNNAVGTYLFIDNMKYITNSIYNMCALEILSKLMSQEYFYQLRTVEKFGYIVGSNINTITNCNTRYLYYRFVVQSQKSIDKIISRTLEFIGDFSKKLSLVTNSEFEDVVNACIKNQEEPTINLNELANEKFFEIQHNINKFNFKSLLIDCYKTIKLENIVEFYSDKFLNNTKIIISI